MMRLAKDKRRAEKEKKMAEIAELDWGEKLKAARKPRVPSQRRQRKTNTIINVDMEASEPPSVPISVDIPRDEAIRRLLVYKAD